MVTESITLLAEDGTVESQTITIESDDWRRWLHEEQKCSMWCDFCYNEATQAASQVFQLS